MRLYVYVLEARDLHVTKSNNSRDAYYVKLQLKEGKSKSKTRVLKKTQNPVWNEEFVFRVIDLDEQLMVSIFKSENNSGFFNGSNGGELLGWVWVPVSSLISEHNRTLPPTWFNMEKPKNGSKDSVYGKILLTLSLNGSDNSNIHSFPALAKEWDVPVEKSHDLSSSTSSRKIPEGKRLVKAIASRLEKIFKKNYDSDKNESRTDEFSQLSSLHSGYEDCGDDFLSDSPFEEAIELMHLRDDDLEMPEDLQGGILLDQTYAVPSKDLNKLLFTPNSQFRKDLAELQGTTDLQESPWIWKSGEISCLSRVVSYTKAASKIVKALKATEEQTYVKASKKESAVMVNVNTPDVPYGNCFKVELLYKIVPGPELSSGQESAHLIISWDVNFCQSTVMRRMIEGGARQGLKESFGQFENLLGQIYKPMDSAEILDKEQVLTSLQTEHQSDWQLASEYFWNFTVFFTVIMAMYVLLHIQLSVPDKLQGLEFRGLDLPDTFGELITSGILVLQLERVFNMISHFVEARLQRGNDHGVKSHGDGWVLTVALIEGNHLASVDKTLFSDPYVVFTCNGKIRMSSVKLQTPDPQWNEILEFDAMEEPPSVLDVEVFDFEGPFDQAASLGHAEINFLKHASTDLADIWVTLDGKLAQASQSKLHLRIFLDNDKEVETIKEYLVKMEKEVGKKLNLRSLHRNSVFQKLFGLPPEEFLIIDFSCYLKRKMPLQGRLFVSARIIGFYANFFGHKTKFFFLWEDIEDVQVISPSLSSVGSPSLVIVLRKGRGLDARHGAKSLDEEGRLKFHFQSFISFNVVSRTIMALWRTRTLTSEQKAELGEDQQEQDEKYVQLEDSGPLLGVEDASMSKVYSAELPVDVESLMEMFEGGNLEHKVVGRCGCLNYVMTPWEIQNSETYERHLCYKFNRHVSIFGGDVTSTQKKYPITDGKGWILDEVMTLHDVPFGDYFRVHLRYQIEGSPFSFTSCQCDVYLGITWLKSTKFEQRIVRNITKKFTTRLKEMFELVETEFTLAVLPHGNLT